MKPKEIPIAKPGSWKEAAAAAGVTLVEHSEGLEPALVETTKKRRSLKEMRTAPVKRKESSAKITDSEKKMFKEFFNTDKARLQKRQAKYNKPANFLLLVEDNVHQAGPGGAGTAGKIMAYGQGALLEKYLGNGVKYDQTDSFIHKNSFDFQRKEVANTAPVNEVPQLGGRSTSRASQPTKSKYELHLEAIKDAKRKDVVRRRKNFDFDSD